MKSAIVAALLATATVTAVQAAPQSAPGALPEKLPEASIPFANHHGIWDWQATDDHTLYVQDVHRAWYRVSVFAPCIDLPWSHDIGFETKAGDTFDRFSNIIVGGQRCAISSVVKSDPPPQVRAKKGQG